MHASFRESPRGYFGLSDTTQSWWRHLASGNPAIPPGAANRCLPTPITS